MSFRILAIALLVACGGSSATPDARPADAALDARVEPPPHRCDVADCEGGFARTCDRDPQSLDCSAFGATCGAFKDTETSRPFNWCTCGTIAEADGFCLSGRYGVTCIDGLGGLADCGEGYLCVPRPNGPFGIGCECNNIADGICPAISCGGDPDCATCTPMCSGKQCGDNGCGGECGTCDLGKECTAQGRCETICVPDCTGKECGSDGCGGSCGTCDGTCTADGKCQGACVPSCTGRECGSDGCGGSCGTCSDPFSCQLGGRCDCDFFDEVKYKFTIPPQNQLPADFQLVTVNVWHIKADGTEGSANGAFMGYRPNAVTEFTHRVFGCVPKIRVKREYSVDFRSCVAEQIVMGRADIAIPAPIVNADGSCTAPPL